jgi:DmsE family decaheme c-type cytochrome
MIRRRCTLAAASSILLLMSISACTRARMVDSTGADGARQTTETEALLPPPAPPENYIGAQLCRACHPAIATTFSQTKMGRLFLNSPRNSKEAHACETCHGPGKAHMEAGGGRGKGGLISFAVNDPTPIAVRNAICLDCHAGGDRLFWQSGAHASRDVACTNCHRVMENISPKHNLAKVNEIETCGTCHLQKRAQQMRSSHMPLREGKISCSSCHNPHGTVSQSLLKEDSPNEVCYTCHAEKRGPFLWEHVPVSENCMNCHEPHGTNHEKLLKVSMPRLCQQCHVVQGHPSNPYGPDSPSLKFVVARQCANCHANIHGSNHPAGRLFTR